MPSSRARRPSSTSSSDGEQPNCSPAWEAFDDVLRLLSRSLHDAQDVATDVAMQMCQAGGGMPQVVKRDHKALHDGCKIQCIAHDGRCKWATEVRPVVDEDGRGERIKVWRCVFLNARHDHQSSSKTIGVQVTQQVTTRQGIGIQTDERGSNDVVHTPLFHQSSTGENPITSWQVHSKRRLSPQLDTGHGAKRHKAFNTTSKGNSEGRGSRVIAAKQQLPAKFGHLKLADINKDWPAKARMRHTLWFYVQETVLAGQYAEPDHTALELFNREWEALRARYEGRWESLSSWDPATLLWDVESGSSDATQDYEYAAGRQSGNIKSGGARQKASDRSNTPAKVRRSSTSAQAGASQLPAYTPSSPIRIGNVRATESVSQTRVSRQLHSVTPAPAGPQMGTFQRPAKPEVARARAQLAQRISASTSTANELRRSPQAASRVPARAAPRPGTGAGMPLPGAGLFPLSAAGATFGAQHQRQISQIQLPPGYALIQSSDVHRPPFWPFPAPVVPPNQGSGSSSVQPASRTEATSLSQRGRSDHH